MSKPSLLQIVKSVIAGLIGVQSGANLEKDFQHGSLTSYVVIGIIVTLLFIFALVKVVSLVIA
ncbi:DUF2970 domain-containing protein [Methylomonas sp. AM2-LC]|uniref:DUF2970 domain-containing protein n=1 Tax=Methylomonas sp. AM2-LC TaxID=3153301 RepID=UPI00326592D3